MTDAAPTPRQRRVLLGLTFAVIVALGILGGYIPTTIANLTGPATEERSGTVVEAETPGPASDSPLATPAQARGIADQVRAGRVFNQIRRQVEVLRGLPHMSQVPLTFPTEQEMAGLLRLLYETRACEEQLEPYILLGLLPAGDRSLNPRAIEAVYVPEQGQIYIADGAREQSADDQALVVHAYAHALQYQHFGLSLERNQAETTDGALALEALLEGDTVLVAGLYRYGSIAAADWDHLGELILSAERPSFGEGLDRNPAFDRLAHFPNWEGRQFVQVLYEDGAWEAVDKAYASPPQSTEQILHPERYAERQSGLLSVLVPDLSDALGEEWTLVWQDTYGEFVMGLYLGLILPEARAWSAVDGWSGDTFVLWEDGSGSSLWLWRSMWDSTDEAGDFESALLTLAPHCPAPVRELEAPEGLDGHWYETGTGIVHFSRVGRYVVWLAAPDLNTAANVAEQLP